MTITAPPLNPVMTTMLELSMCVCSELTETGAGPTCWCGLWPGLEVSWEYCGGECSDGTCGMAWVRMAGVNPYEVFPTPIVDLRCALPLAVTIEVGALRCMPIPADGEILAPTDMAEVALEQVADMWALRRAVLCCDNPNLGFGFYTPVGPGGACVGGYWTVFLAVD